MTPSATRKPVVKKIPSVSNLCGKYIYNKNKKFLLFINFYYLFLAIQW